MKWLPLHLRRQVHLSSYMLKILNGQSLSNFINKFTFISGGSRDGANCNLYTPKFTLFYAWLSMDVAVTYSLTREYYIYYIVLHTRLAHNIWNFIS